MSIAFPTVAKRFGSALLSLMLLFCVTTSSAADTAALTPSVVLDRMEQTGRRQQSVLREWSNIRVYRAGNERLHKSAEVTVQLNYAAPGQKTYRVIRSVGSQLIAKKVIYPILDAELHGANPTVRTTTDINRQNYMFEWLRFDAEENAHVFSATPRSPGRYHFRGSIWVDADTFGIKRVVGSPATSPSFWVVRTEFAHEYSRVQGFWLPVGHHSEAQLRIFGRSTLQIDYLEYLGVSTANGPSSSDSANTSVPAGEFGPTQILQRQSEIR